MVLPFVIFLKIHVSDFPRLQSAVGSQFPSISIAFVEINDATSLISGKRHYIHARRRVRYKDASFSHVLPTILSEV